LLGNNSQFVINAVLQLITIVVLIFTCVAAFKQSKAASMLTKATELQIKTGAEQAEAAKQQVAVAKRQITESLRPILTLRVIHIEKMEDGSEELVVKAVNDGAGAGLDVWWMYGRPGIDPDERHYVQDGMIPPRVKRFFRVRATRAVNEGVLVVYDSLSGIKSGTGIHWTGGDPVLTYHPEIDDWAKSLLGRILRPTRGDS